jgi:hypothetical protein
MVTRPDGRLVWVKVAESDADRVRVRAEASTLATLRHPNVVELVESRDDHGIVTTSYCARTDLARTPPRSVAALANTAEALVAIVRELHELGWSHGALTADHCLLGAGDRLVLCSFSRARPISGTGHPAARADRDALRSMIASWRDELAPTLGRGDREALARLDRALAASRPTTPLFRRPTEPPPEPPTPTRVDRAHASSTWRGAAARSIAFAGMLVVLLAVSPPSSQTTAIGTVAHWTLMLGRPLAAYGLIVSLIWAIALRSRRPRLERIGRRLAPAPLRRVITGVALAGAVSTVAAHVQRPTRPTTAQVTVQPSTSHVATTTTVPPSTVAPTTSEPAEPPPVVIVTEAPSPPSQPPPAAPATWTIRAGDHMWRIAEQTLTAAWGTTPDDDQIDPYWRLLVAVNRTRFADPRNPDLIFVGQVLDLPPTPPAPTAAAA